jgi:hypothetical protein
MKRFCSAVIWLSRVAPCGIKRLIERQAITKFPIAANYFTFRERARAIAMLTMIEAHFKLV